MVYVMINKINYCKVLSFGRASHQMDGVRCTSEQGEKERLRT
jgi:hypothetical protein